MDAGVDDAQECVGVAFVAAFHVAVILACGKEKFGQRGPLLMLVRKSGMWWWNF